MANTTISKELYEQINQNISIKIDVLNWEEKKIIASIKGYCTGGSLNLSGTSAVRRTGSLTIITDENNIIDDQKNIQNFNNIDTLFSVSKKIKIWTGIDTLDGDTKWIPQGVFIIKNPSLNRSLSGISISLTLSDKMCLLNGELGGNLPASVVFSEMEVQHQDGTITKNYPLISDIIKTLITQYGGVQSYLIKDVSDTVKKVMKWGLNRNLYKYELNGSNFLSLKKPDGETLKTYKYNETVGYIKVPFTWPGQTLSANAGETITSVLDKIKALADYEYFFDVNGVFIWQKKNTYVYNSLQQESIKNEVFFGKDLSKITKNILPQHLKNSSIAYEFDTTNLITALTNTPQYNNIKNDFIIWGKRKTASGVELPIRYRLVFSNNYPKKEITTVENCREYEVINGIKGYKKYTLNTDKTISTLPFKNENDDIYYKIDEKYYHWIDDKYQVTTIAPGKSVEYTANDRYQTQIYLDGVNNNSNYFDSPLYKDLEVEWPKLYNVTADIDSRNWRTESMPQGDEIDYYCHLINVPGQNVENIGRYQTKVINDNTINCIYSPDIPADILNRIGDNYTEKNNYNVINVPEEIYDNLYAGGSENSAFEVARRLVSYYTSYNNSISLTTIPIYELQPNDIIKVEDDESGIHGYYVVNSISLPLTYNGTMNISASRALTQEAKNGN